MNENFSKNLKKARRDARMTQAEVAKIVGVAIGQKTTQNVK